MFISISESFVCFASIFWVVDYPLSRELLLLQARQSIPTAASVHQCLLTIVRRPAISQTCKHLVHVSLGKYALSRLLAEAAHEIEDNPLPKIY